MFIHIEELLSGLGIFALCNLSCSDPFRFLSFRKILPHPCLCDGLRLMNVRLMNEQSVLLQGFHGTIKIEFPPMGISRESFEQ